MNPAAANVVLNTIVAEAMDEMCNQMEGDLKAKPIHRPSKLGIRENKS